jgi:hypothetical protein
VPWRRWLSQRKRYLSHALAVALGGGGLGGAGGGFLVLPGGLGAAGGPGGGLQSVTPCSSTQDGFLWPKVQL